jgi:hypothetical protein
MIASDPCQGGATWAVLQYVLGLRELGHRVLLVEPVRAACLQPSGVRLEESVNARYFRSVVKDFGLDDDAALLCEASRSTVGLCYERLAEFASSADLLINISGMLTDERLCGPIPTRAYLDLDPAFVQCWHDQGTDMRFSGHTHFVTIGMGVGTQECPVPTCGLNWIKTLQPVVLSHWSVAGPVVREALTTIGNWRGYGSVEHQGVRYGQKAHSLRPLLELPRQTAEVFQLAMSIHPGESADLESLHRFGWQLVNPASVAATPQQYRTFIQGSKAEFGIAKSGYVRSRSGWFSDRSVCYLASGRPVIAQETGFSRILPTGDGLFAFTNAADVIAAIDSLNAEYEHHRRAARALAEDWFAAHRVLAGLLDRLGTAP